VPATDFPFIDPDVRDASGHLIRELHGVTLKAILEALVQRFGWPELASRIRINCFALNPSVKSSLTFLRRTPWARARVEDLYVAMRLEDAAAGSTS
jgi:uncharacterized protein (DUF2132 family)